MLVAFDPQSSKDSGIRRTQRAFQRGIEVCDGLLRLGRQVWRRKCSAAVRSRILCQQRQLESGYPLRSVTKCHTLYAHKPIR